MVSSTLYCSNCGTINPAQAKFCFGCGQSVQNSIAPPGAVSLTGLLIHDQTLDQRYRIIGQVGRGGFGAVYKAIDLKSGNRLVAVKEMSQSGLSQQELIKATNAFTREALLLASLSHPNLPCIYAQFTEMGRWYLVMDFIEGETLEDYLRKTPGGFLLSQKYSRSVFSSVPCLTTCICASRPLSSATSTLLTSCAHPRDISA